MTGSAWIVISISILRIEIPLLRSGLFKEEKQILVMAYTFTVTTSGATANDFVKLKMIEKRTLRDVKAYFGDSYATSGGCA